MGASMGGLETSIVAVTSALIEGRSATVVTDDNTVLNLYAENGAYKRVVKMSGHTCHGILLHKSSVFEEEAASHSPVIIAKNGDLQEALGQFLSAKYALPKEWKDKYFYIIPEFMKEKLGVYVNPLYKDWQDLRAIRLSSEVTEEFLLQEIDARLKDGRLTIPEEPNAPQGKFSPKWDTKEYLVQNAQNLAQKLDRIKPRHNPMNDKLDRCIAEMGRVPFPTQAHLIQGTANTLDDKTSFRLNTDKESSVFCGGDMGVGKSIVSLGVANVLYHRKGSKGFKVLLVAPGITLPKWAFKEIKATLPDAKVRILRNHDDALQLLKQAKEGYEPEGMEFVLVGTDRAKLGPEPWCSAIWKRVSGVKYYSWHCPSCFTPLEDPEAEKETDDILAGWNTLAHGESPERKDMRNPKNKNGVPINHELNWKLRAKLKKCQACDTKLWRPGLKHRGEARNKPRWYISRVLKKMKGYFDLFIQDEVHQTKAQDSGRGDAFAQMVKSAKKCLMLTGTLVNGKSTSIKEILWRTDPKALLDQGFDHQTGMVQWAGRYGVLKKVTKIDETDDGITVRKKKTEYQPTEEPGIAPQMTAQFLLHKTCFAELSDLGLPLVELKELPTFLKIDDDHRLAYKEFHETLYDRCKTAAALGSKGAWSKFIPATINYADRPDLGAEVIFKKDSDRPEIIAAPQFPENYYHSKERWLVETIKKELAENRGIVIYNNYTDGYGMNERIKKVLADHGIQADILRSSTTPEERVEWLAKKEEEGRKVLITNMRLVEVGLDLLAWPSILFYQLNYDINIIRQSSRRSWRIGQHRECRVYYAVYDETQQMAQFYNIMAKRGHAMMVEGRLDRSELAKYSRDSHTAMASDLANCLAGANLANQWQELAAKDMDKNLKIVSESDFKVELDKAIKALVSETRRLCGVPEPVEVEVKQIEVRPAQPQKLSSQVQLQATGTDGIQLSLMIDSETNSFTVELKVVEKPAKKSKASAGQLRFDW
jgi:hypothetical protein